LIPLFLSRKPASDQIVFASGDAARHQARRDHDRVVERVGEKGRRNDRAGIVVGVPAFAVEGPSPGATKSASNLYQRKGSLTAGRAACPYGRAKLAILIQHPKKPVATSEVWLGRGEQARRIALMVSVWHCRS
jgi:hypothetical protein